MRVAPRRVRIPDLCVFLADPKQRVPSVPPFLCIEILSPDDRMSRVEVRINDFLAMGVNTVWVLDPETRQAYTATAADGLREVKTGALRTESPVIEMSLAEVFGNVT
ncbi:MAG: Uma2 family endonuclease [Bryobacteraceae bacterium]